MSSATPVRSGRADPRVPWATGVAVAVVVVGWIVAVARGADPWSPSADDLVRAGGSGGDAGRAAWRLVTAWTVHAGALHLVFDVALLAAVGPALERRAGHATTALAIGAGAFTAAAVSRWWSAYTLSVGASGAAFALAAALAVRVVRTRRDGSARWAAIGIAAFAVANVVAAAVAPSIDHAAHAGGALAGLLVGGLIEIGRGGPVIGAVAAAALGLAAAGTAPAPADVGATLREIDALEVRYRTLLAERAAGPDHDRAADAALAREIRAEVAAPLAELAADLAPGPEMPPRLRGRLAAAGAYLAARRDGLELYIRYLETGDTALRKAIVESDHRAQRALQALRRSP